MHVHVRTSVHKEPEEGLPLDPSELELQMAVSCPVLVLGPKPESSGKAAALSTAEPCL